MYKVREAAKLLNVETIDIHKKLISLKRELGDHVRKSNGITMIDQDGIDIISLSFAGKSELEDNTKNISKKVSENGDDIPVESIDSKGSVTNGTEDISGKKDLNLAGRDGNKEIPVAVKDIYKLKADINSKKTELNSINQKIIVEIQKTANYTLELNDVYKRIKNLIG